MTASLLHVFIVMQKKKVNVASADHRPALAMRLRAGGNGGFLIRHQQERSEDRRRPRDAADGV